MLLVPDIVHPFDPRFIDFGDDRPYYILAAVSPSQREFAEPWMDSDGFIAARVDVIDYQFFCRWGWLIKFDRHGRKPYVYRKPGGGVSSIFLHVAVKERADPDRPPGYTMVDHEDGDSLNCQRYNLRYATPSMNRRNIKGQRSLRI